MKFLLMFFIFMVLLWQWRNRSGKVSEVKRKNTPPPGLVTMVACAQCGLHLPATDAIAGKLGVYCSAEHRLAREP